MQIVESPQFGGDLAAVASLLPAGDVTLVIL